jgi:hypothetical protein
MMGALPTLYRPAAPEAEAAELTAVRKMAEAAEEEVELTAPTEETA